MSKPILIAPSLLAADFTKLADEIKKMEEAGADWFHIDVMDGHFVPNITLGPFIVEAIRKKTQLPLDVHLMIENPLKYIPVFHQAGGDLFTFHIETCQDPIETIIEKVKSLRKKVGVAYRPSTPLPNAQQNSFLSKVDIVLLMTVDPGFGGQTFIPEVLEKIKKLRQFYPGYIQVDGGINNETAPSAIKAGADVLVSGTYLFRSHNVKEAITLLRGGL